MKQPNWERRFERREAESRTSFNRERDEVMGNVPHHSHHELLTRECKPNAFVYVDEYGRLGILLEKGGWLGAQIDELQADIAPLSD